MSREVETTGMGPDTPDRILDEVKQFLLQEQLLFGDMLLSESRSIRTDIAVTSKKQIVAEEPFLFELPPAPSYPLTTEPWGSAPTLDDLNRQICTCVKCSLGHTRTKFVFGVGNPNATLMLVGEAPGADEDAQGEPLVGRAGQLLNKILEAINFKREDVYICNILKCRPPGNRTPQADEVEQCVPYLKKQIR